MIDADLVTQALALLGYLIALVGALGVCAIALALYDHIRARAAFRGLPAPDTPDLRVKRMLDAYNGRVHARLR